MFDMMVSFSVFFPILAGSILFMFPEMKEKTRNIYTFAVSLINLAVIVYIAAANPWLKVINAGFGADMTGEGRNYTHFITLISFTDRLTLQFAVDGLGMLFALLVSVLWPFSLLYSYDYMEEYGRKSTFYAFFMMTLGSVLGIAFSGDMFSMYIFYEILTLVTFPLVMHEMSKEALAAGGHYLVYMLGGAAFAFIGMVVVMHNSYSLDFQPGGILNKHAWQNQGMMLVFFFITFVGFSVKAAMMPFGKWLISAAVAPMPVTALLHAVAVVKAGSFAVIRLIYYVYGTELIRGTWAQYAAIALCAFTVLYGSTMAVKEPHLKRRMAYSTISNLSYILFGACIMTPMGMYAALMHTAAHAVTKIALFLSVGAIMHVTGKCFIYEIDGLGRRMKGIFICLLLGALSIIGIPQFMGFNSKISLLRAAIDGGGLMDYVGAFSIIISALLTAVYLLNIIIRGYFPRDNAKCERFEECHDPGWRMMVPIGLASAATLILGIWWQPLSSYLKAVSGLM